MKCTNKKKKLSKNETRKKQVKKTVFLSFFLVIILLAGALSVLLLRNHKRLDVVFPFSIETEVFAMTPDENSQVVNGMAASLCVAASDVAMDGLETKNNEKAALFDVSDAKVLFSKGLYERAYPASITKIMTAIIALKNGELSDTVTISNTAVAMDSDSQVCGFKEGDKVTLDELLHGLLVYSGNDAAMAIAEHVGGSVEGFVALMNEEAKKLGATGTHFVNPHGLHDPEHYTSAYDIYLMLNEALNYKEFVSITQMRAYTLSYKNAEGKDAKLNLESTDKYLTGEVMPPKDVTILGGKTGTTGEAGACLAILSQNAYGKPYISIVLNAKTKTALYERMNQLLQKIN